MKKVYVGNSHAKPCWLKVLILSCLIFMKMNVYTLHNIFLTYFNEFCTFRFWLWIKSPNQCLCIHFLCTFTSVFWWAFVLSFRSSLWATVRRASGWLWEWRAVMWRCFITPSQTSTSCTCTRAVSFPSNLPTVVRYCYFTFYVVHLAPENKWGGSLVFL